MDQETLKIIIDDLRKRIKKLREVKRSDRNQVYGKNITEGKISKGGRNAPPITPRLPEPSAQKT